MGPDEYRGNAQAQRLPSFAPDAGTVGQSVGGVAAQPPQPPPPTILDAIYQLASGNLNRLQEQVKQLQGLADRLGVPYLPESTAKPQFDSPSGEGIVSNVRDMAYLTSDALTRLEAAVSRLEQL
jgi:hypothetical protein